MDQTRVPFRGSTLYKTIHLLLSCFWPPSLLPPSSPPPPPLLLLRLHCKPEPRTMNLSLSRTISLSHLILWVIFVFASCVLSVEERHRICSSPFPCGNQTELSYPFWIKGREDCGHPDFELDCNRGFAEFNISSVNLRILEVDFLESRSITLARTDYLNTLCPSNLVNVSLFNEIFLGYLPGTEVITLYHDCRDFPGFSPTVYIGELPCEYDDGGKGYFVTRNISLPLLDGVRAMLNEFTRSCEQVDIPASGTALVALQASPTPQNLQMAFDEGFGLTLNYATCEACRESGGACGYNRTAEAFVCYCMNDSHERTCDSGKKSSSGLHGGVKIGIGLACGLVGGLLIAGGVFCFIRQRRKKLWAQYTSKDLPTTPYSSTGTTTTATSTTVSRSMHSFQSSDSNLGNGSVYFGVKVFGYEELEEATENFSKELGDGGFGTVYYGVLRDGRAVAVKRLYERSLRRVEQFKNEIDILKSLKHPNLVILYGCTSRHSRELLLVYEYISNGTLADHLHGDRAKTHHLSWPVRLEIAIETANALSYLHASGIIHRDVKTTNILLDNNFQVKVADFGLSRLFPTDATHVSTAPQGTPGYVDPEYYQCYRLNEKSDVYSFGVVLAELISSKEAVDIARHRHDINLANMAVARIQNSAVEELVDPDLGFDRDFAVRRMVTAVAELAFRCLQQEREVRPSMDEVVEALRGIKKEEMSEPAEMVDIRGGDDVVLLRNGGAPPLLSPETDKWTNSSNSNTTGSSF
ncbi:PREDICTED: LOW QUALITY PROTEIN: LEAF RUST 10 DISEASE-RESISTANCE LOCUS RECEPTOR-LIKE PROTEIN KINASE-like 1.3 [Tarenaya hassleriana]|uniref:LOW QUALITY PROTEIN: LEAF RUST 10 DISEASE-RESISTANCE LOCUS RECEPTOR-LIKE PROTEIN KINASE-like 1.3 n=1 Tax=Tarenaya hassleriana TaxID=28532 RepID=UPI0008FD57A6|nr:PREDICTED: LOW QUALITY PROTEIN: LEAF RUST 10 DISEASE-RESISTANCE LOCUS RECEPTOR-LIKE PROTEIN KINASE-like 1.3 [Tarenaya hassleriana]